MQSTAPIEEERLYDDENAELVTVWLRRLTVIVCVAATATSAALAAGFAARHAWVGGGVSLGLIGLALLAEGTSRVAWLSEVVFAGYALLGALSIWQGGSPEWVILAISTATVGWDLHHFRQRLAAVERVGTPALLTANHLRRLALTVLSGMALSFVALYVRITYGVTVVIVLGLLAVFGISRAVAYLRRFSD